MKTFAVNSVIVMVVVIGLLVLMRPAFVPGMQLTGADYPTHAAADERARLNDMPFGGWSDNPMFGGPTKPPNYTIRRLLLLPRIYVYSIILILIGFFVLDCFFVAGRKEDGD